MAGFLYTICTQLCYTGYMRILTDSQEFISNEHYVFQVDEEGMCLKCKFSIEDIIINSPEGDVLLAWNNDLDPSGPFPTDKCFLIPGKPDMKEITRVMCSAVALKSVKGTVKVYLTLQRN